MTIETIERTPRNTILQGDCGTAMRHFEPASVDFILTDPPYIAHYRGRDGRTVFNDDNSHWLKPAFMQMHRVLKPGGFCVSFYGWNKVDLFMDAWRSAFLSFPKKDASPTPSHYARFYRGGARRQNRTGNLPRGAPPITARR